MVSQGNLLSRIAALVAGFDDASWEALASKGLLRRARKDIEKGLQLEVLEETADELRIKVPPFLVSFPVSGPAKATCTCPTPGVCQHVLAAGLYLQRHVLASNEPRVGPTEDSIREEVSLITPERLKAWLGTADYRAGVSLLEKNSAPPIIEYEETVIVRLMPSSIEARFVPGGGLDGMILPNQHGKRVAVAALLALRKSLGLEIPVAAVQQSLIELTGTPRTKKEILESACSVLEDAIAVGLSHVSPVVADRLMTLAVSAQGANLPRVSLALRAVADEASSILRREARADEARLLILMARVYALMEAIGRSGENPRIDFAGAHRAQYVEVPESELFGVGAYTWKTGSGYSGLTVLFWSNQTKEFLSWSEARPGTQQFDPRQRFYAEGPWNGAQSPRQVASSNLKLRHARRTANGRLSSSTKTSALVLEATSPQALEFGEKLFTSWKVLRRYVCQRQPLGLRESNPLELIGILEPNSFGPRAFDSITQTFTWEVYDEVDEALTLSLPFRDWSKDAIRILEELSPSEELRWRIVVRLDFRDDLLSVEPISILRPEDPKSPVFQLSFDALPQPRTNNPTRSTEPAYYEELIEEAGPEVDESFGTTTTYLYSVITELNRRLQAIAESGAQNGLEAHREWFEKLLPEVHSSGLTCLAAMFDALSNPHSAAPGLILRARFLAHLHSQAIGHL
jgi:hypothetical protein